MLEEQALLLEPWTMVRGEGGEPQEISRKLIRSATGGQVLGFARKKLLFPFWFSWPAREVVEVLETEDASLLMTLRRFRGPFQTWKAYDAEERLVGKIYRQVLWDKEGRKLGVAQPQAKAFPGTFRDPQGNPLGTYEIRGDQKVLLTFSGLLRGNPFGRMILLGAVLSWT